MTCLNLQHDDLSAKSLTTESSQAEQEDLEQLLQQQKLDAIGSLACGISHEFNNLLQTINGYTKFALESLAVDSQAHKDLQHVLSAADRAMVLTQQLLDFSRVEQVNAQCSRIDQVVRDLVEMLQPLLPGDIDLQINLDANSTWALIDAQHIHQALLNLCLNARDAMPAGGVILIESSTGVLTDSCLVTKPGLSPSSSYVCLTVTDTGTGIPEEVQKHVFEPFYTTKEVGKGTGLGLAVTIGVIQQAGGHIELSSTLDHGTTFEIYLPACLESSLDLSSLTCPDSKELLENS